MNSHDTSFSADQYDLAYPDGIEHYWWNRYRSGLIARLCRAETSPGAELLEVGCGRGGEVAQLRRAGLEATGVELAPVTPVDSAAAFVLGGQDANELPAAERARVRCILLFDVLEHLPDPADFLRRLQSSFDKLEVVIVTVPARAELWSNYDDFYGHFRRYTPAMLEELGQSLGWRTHRAAYFFKLLYLPMRLMSALGISRGTAVKPPRAGLRGLHHLVASMHRLEEWLLPGSVPGTSAYAVFRLDWPVGPDCGSPA